jgi:hypothetical protein
VFALDGDALGRNAADLSDVASSIGMLARFLVGVVGAAPPDSPLPGKESIGLETDFSCIALGTARQRIGLAQDVAKTTRAAPRIPAAVPEPRPTNPGLRSPIRRFAHAPIRRFAHSPTFTQSRQ